MLNKDSKMPWGQYKGERIGDILVEHPWYLKSLQASHLNIYFTKDILQDLGVWVNYKHLKMYED